MKCTNPNTFGNARGVPVPCGQCMACRINRQREIVTKALLESYSYPDSTSFITLTYAPEHLPDAEHFPGGNLIKADVQKFIKRLRMNTKLKLRYLAVGEYGEKSQRAHFHLLMYGIPRDMLEHHVKKAWTLGHSMSVMLPPGDDSGINRIKYTAGYTIKKMTSERDYEDGRNPEFCHWSRKPALGTKALGAIGRKLHDLKLMPTGWASQDEEYVLKRVMQRYPDYNLWHGTINVSRRLLRFDKHMRKMLFADMFSDEFEEMKDYCDILSPLAWRQARRYKECNLDFKLLRIIKDEEITDVETKNREERKAKFVEKSTRLHAKKRTL